MLLDHGVVTGYLNIGGLLLTKSFLIAQGLVHKLICDGLVLGIDWLW